MKTFFLGIKGIITNSNRVLLLEKSRPNPFWEAPGGRINENEQPHEALLRELQEELPGIHNISIGQKIGSSIENVNPSSDIGLILFYYRVEASLSDPLVLSSEHRSYQWIGADTPLPHISSNELKRIIREMHLTQSSSTNPIERS